MPSNVLPLRLKQTVLPIIWIFTEGEGDEIESRLPFKIFSTLKSKAWENVGPLYIDHGTACNSKTVQPVYSLDHHAFSSCKQHTVFATLTDD